MSIYYRCPDVLWHTVGVNHEETLLIKEGLRDGDETRMFIVSGQTGAAIWSRLDGIRSAEDISNELAATRRMPLSAAQTVVIEFLDVLKENGLAVTDITVPFVASEVIAWPESIHPPSLAPLELESLVAEEMVALASYTGGKNNTGGTGICQVGLGGLQNTTGNPQFCTP